LVARYPSNSTPKGRSWSALTCNLLVCPAAYYFPDSKSNGHKQLADDIRKGMDGDVATHDLIAKEGGKAIFVKADVSIAADMESLIAAAVAEYGRLDMYVTKLPRLKTSTNIVIT
jgi:hypothetical protein